MASSSLLYIAWPVTLGLAFVAGGMILSPSKDKDKPEAVATSNGKTKNSGVTNSRFNGTDAQKPNRNRRKPNITQKKTGSNTSPKNGSLSIKEIMDLDDPIERTRNLLSILDTLAPSDFKDCVEQFRSLGITREHKSEYTLLLTRWAKVDPEGALAYTEKNTTDPFASMKVIEAWASYDSTAALAWIDKNKDEFFTEDLTEGVIKGIASKDPYTATKLLNEADLSYFGKVDALRSIIPHISNLGSEKAMAWVETLGDPKLRQKAVKSLISDFVKTDPNAAAKWVTGLDDESKIQAAHDVAAALSKQDLNQGLEWTNSLNGEAKVKAAAAVMTPYAKNNPAEAATWMKTMSQQKGYQRVVQSFIAETGRSNPSIALDHINEIDERVRPMTKSLILVAWAARDESGASNWMQNNNISGEEKDKLLRGAQKAKEAGLLNRNLLK